MNLREAGVEIKARTKEVTEQDLSLHFLDPVLKREEKANATTVTVIVT